MLSRRSALISLAAAALARPGLAWAGEPTFAVADLKADLRAMYEGLKEAHYDLYAMTSKAVMDRAFATTLAGLDRPLTLLETRIAFQRFAAVARMGHTRVDTPYDAWGAYRKAGGLGFPLDVRIIDGRMYVAADRSELSEIAPGDEILGLNGRPVRHWITRAGRNVSAETDYMLWSLLEYDLALLLWLELGEARSFALDLRKPDGRRLSLTLPARTRQAMEATAREQPPVLSLEPAREVKMLEGGVAYLRPGPFYNIEAKTEAEGWDNTAFKAFVDDAFARFEQAGATRLLVNLRGNPGGDSSFSDLVVSRIADRPFRFVSQFLVKISPQAIAANDARLKADAAAAGPVSRQFAELYARSKLGERVAFDVPQTAPAARRFAGKAFLLVDRQSYSNTVAVAATVQDYGFGTVLGEETSDLATTYGAIERFTLPRTGVSVGFPKARLIRPNGNLKARGVVPDVTVAAPIVATPADEMLRDALKAMRI